MTLPPELLEEVKSYLGITWDDEKTDKETSGIIARGMSRINQVGGAVFDFDEDAKPKELLLEYCFYAHSKALSEFEDAYLSELLSLQMHQEIKDWKEACDETEGAANV